MCACARIEDSRRQTNTPEDAASVCAPFFERKCKANFDALMCVSCILKHHKGLAHHDLRAALSYNSRARVQSTQFSTCRTQQRAFVQGRTESMQKLTQATKGLQKEFVRCVNWAPALGACACTITLSLALIFVWGTTAPPRRAASKQQQAGLQR